MGIAIGRTIDYSDIWALLVLPLAYCHENRSDFRLPLKAKYVVPVAAFAFISTTLAPRTELSYTDIDKNYQFAFSRQSLIDRLNRISADKISDLHRQHAIIFNSDGDYFHYSWSSDTLALMLDAHKINDGDTIEYKKGTGRFPYSG